jgi:hypothetical protein
MSLAGVHHNQLLRIADRGSGGIQFRRWVLSAMSFGSEMTNEECRVLIEMGIAVARELGGTDAAEKAKLEYEEICGECGICQQVDRKGMK